MGRKSFDDIPTIIPGQLVSSIEVSKRPSASVSSGTVPPTHPTAVKHWPPATPFFSNKCFLVISEIVCAEVRPNDFFCTTFFGISTYIFLNSLSLLFQTPFICAFASNSILPAFTHKPIVSSSFLINSNRFHSGGPSHLAPPCHKCLQV